jgi:hypothetical protein
VEVFGHEVTERRCTFVIPDAARDRAARIIYADTFGAAVAI